MKVTLIDKNEKGAETIIKALSLCRNKQCNEKTIDHCLQAKPTPHLSALEFVWYCFLVEGVSIKTRLQQARHRTFSSMERSTRHINMEDAEMIVPPTRIDDGEGYEWDYNEIRETYAEYLAYGEAIEDAAYILPVATGTKFVLAGNGRVWFEYFQKRLCRKHVQREHYLMARELYKQVIREVPQFKYAHPCRYCSICKS